MITAGGQEGKSEVVPEQKRLISIVTPCYNEALNIEEVYERTRAVMEKLSHLDYEHVFIDNSSRDDTVEILRRLAEKDNRVRVIVYTRNFGFVRSVHYGMLQPDGDATVLLLSDLQDPPELIASLIEKWEAGALVAQGVRTASEESFLLFSMKKLYYSIVDNLSDVPLLRNSTGFGIYDRKVIDSLRSINDPYPYFKGLIAELGYPIETIEYKSMKRKRGKSSANFLALFDFAMLGITSHSRFPLRIATILGFVMSLLSLLIAAGYFIGKLLFWGQFAQGMASLLVGMFLLSSVQLFFIGVLGEYIGLMNQRLLDRPLVVEKERINFKSGPCIPGRSGIPGKHREKT